LVEFAGSIANISALSLKVLVEMAKLWQTATDHLIWVLIKTEG
jgi:hypothetical protein